MSWERRRLEEEEEEEEEEDEEEEEACKVPFLVDLLFVCLKKQKRFSNWGISPGVDSTEEKLVVEVI